MKHILAVVLGLVVAGGHAYAQEPVIEVADGKVSITAQSVPLSRLLTLWDKAMGTSSEVKPELAGRTISVQFTDLPSADAVHKMFQGQSLNYVFIHGKGIRVYEAVQGGPVTTSVASSPAFPVMDTRPTASPIVTPPPQPPQPVPVPGVTVQGQPNSPQAPVNTLFGVRPDPNANPNAQQGTGAYAPGMAPPPIGAGTAPPPIGAANPFGGPPTTGGVTSAPAPPVQQQPAGPGNVGATPGQVK